MGDLGPDRHDRACRGLSRLFLFQNRARQTLVPRRRKSKLSLSHGMSPEQNFAGGNVGGSTKLRDAGTALLLQPPYQ
jgi:hypothetical protein